MADAKGLVASKKANNTSGRHIHNRSSFDLSYELANTHRFGEYVPTFACESVPTDVITLRSSDEIDSFTLATPFKGSIRKIKESFMVPNMALLPMTWDRIYTQNSNGDDVPQDANCIIQDCTTIGAAWNAWRALVTKPTALTDTVTFIQSLNAAMRVLVLGEYIYSNGSLLNVLGYKASAQFRYRPNNLSSGPAKSYDYLFDQTVQALFKNISYFTVIVPQVLEQPGVNESNTGYTTITVRGLAGTEPQLASLPFRCYLELLRENPNVIISNVTFWLNSSGFGTLTPGTSVTSGSTAAQAGYTNEDSVANALDAFIKANILFLAPAASPNGSAWVEIPGMDPTTLNARTINLSRVLSYQIICWHYYSNSSLDFLYTADLYRQYIRVLYVMANNSLATNGSSFQWNGMNMPYDYLSGHSLQRQMWLFGAAGSSAARPNLTLASLGNYQYANIATSAFLAGVLPTWAAIFSFRKSLRFGDYFTGARPRPLAPVNTDVMVTGNPGQVSVVDITRNIQAQRFANAVMRSRSKIEEYVKDLFGSSPAPDYHNPFYLSREQEIIFGEDVQNTADAQQTDPNSRTANFASRKGRYTFTFRNDDAHPCIYMQIVYYDVKRSYTHSVDRHFLHIDRFDMFNPDFQYIGDQPILGVELGYPLGGANPNTIPYTFAYTTRDMEYKQRFDQASGAFVENLPGWLFTDNELYMSGLYSNGINSDFIRSMSYELDRFYLSLTGYSLGSYYHFMCITNNEASASRPMAVDPQILA